MNPSGPAAITSHNGAALTAQAFSVFDQPTERILLLRDFHRIAEEDNLVFISHIARHVNRIVQIRAVGIQIALPRPQCRDIREWASAFADVIHGKVGAQTRHGAV